MEAVVEKDVLMAILNESLLHDRRWVEVALPWADLTLFNMDVGDATLSDIVRPETYQRALGPFVDGIVEEEVRREIPDFLDLREAFHNSLVLPPQNIVQLTDLIKEVVRKNSTPKNFVRPNGIAVDTNIAYRRVLGRISLEKETWGLDKLDITKLRVLVPQLVKKEVSNATLRKYDNRFMDSTRSIFREFNPFLSMRNCTNKKGRKAQNAATELGLIRDIYTVLEVQGGEWSEDKEMRDVAIMRSLEDYQNDQRMDLTFLTADDKASAHLEAHGMTGLVLRYPLEVPTKIRTDHWLLVELLYELSVLYGTILLRKLGVRVQGDWSGKPHEDYLAEKVKLIIDDASALRAPLERDIAVVKAMRMAVDFRTL